MRTLKWLITGTFVVVIFAGAWWACTRWGWATGEAIGIAAFASSVIAMPLAWWAGWDQSKSPRSIGSKGDVSGSIGSMGDVSGSAAAVQDNHGVINVATSPVHGKLPDRLNTLPANTSNFTGRTEELEHIVSGATTAAGTGRMTIYVIHGMAGVGKTTLALEVGYLLAKRLNIEWQLFVDLGGHTVGEKAKTAEVALTELLADIEVDTGRVVSGLDLTRLWRKHVSGKRVLLILDDADSTEQVKELLPGHGDCCVVLITSRYRLGSLRATLGAEILRLEALPPDQALLLFSRLYGHRLVDTEEAAAKELVKHCGYLAMAICLVAAGADAEGGSAPVAHLRDALIEAAPDRLSAIDGQADDHRFHIRSAFNLSYQKLDPDRQHVLHRVGLHPGTDFDVAAAVALTGLSPRSVHDHLRFLCDAALLTRDGDRYQIHDLIRDYLHDPAICGSDEGLDEAFARLLDHYRLAADQLTAPLEPLLTRHTRPGAVHTHPMPEPDKREAALAWFSRERSTLLACLRRDATSDRLKAAIVGLTSALAGFLRNDGPWDIARELHSAAANLAESLNQPQDQAIAINDLGIMCRLTCQFNEANQVLQQAYDLFHGLSIVGQIDADTARLGKANARNEMGKVANLQGDQKREEGSAEEAVTHYHRAVDFLAEALALYRQVRDEIGVANAAKNLGVARYYLGDRDQAEQLLGQALQSYSALHDALGRAEVHNHLGLLWQSSKSHQRAQQEFQAALSAAPLHSRLEQARALEGIGRCIAEITGRLSFAKPYLQQAREIFDYIGAAYDVTRVDRILSKDANHTDA